MSALIASLFAVGASPAAAIDEKSMQDHTVPHKACLGEAVQDQGFTDLGTLDYAVSSINCLAYYGISAGRTADTFDPKANVTRSEMALFLYATANLMDVDLMGGDMMVDYGDIAELGDNRQDAITALARNGIMSGRGSMAFEPHADITRAEMAVALVSLVDHVSSNLRKNDDGLFVFGDDEEEPEDSFDDAYASVPAAVNNAISAAYELGITSGVGDGTMFDPSGTVRRENMAVFIVNALNHSNVRPAGMTAQVFTRPKGAAEIIVSVRDADFAPVVNVPIDAFKASAPQEDRAFKQDGSCSGRASLVDGSNRCTIEGADPVTRSDGNVRLAQLDADDDIGKDGLTVWLWTGDIGDEFGNDTEYLEISVDPQPKMAADATVAAISSDLGLKGNADARYSQTVTFTIQLQDGDENNAAPPEGGVKYTLVKETYSERVDATGDGADTDTDPETTVSRSTETLTVGDDGSVTFTVNARDLDPNNDSEVTVRYTLSRSTVNTDSSANATVTRDLLVPGTAAATTAGPDASLMYTHTKAHIGIVVFSDADAKVTSVSVDVASHQSAPAGKAVGTAATVTVLDQYGRPMADQGIVLSSNAAVADVTTSSSQRFTGPDGQVRIGYSYKGGAAVEIISAWSETTSENVDSSDAAYTGAATARPNPCPDSMTGSYRGADETVDGATVADVTTYRCNKATTFWVGVVLDADSAVAGTTTADQANDITGPADVLSHDADNQQIVIDGDDDADDSTARAPMAMNYDSNDFFSVRDASNGDYAPVSMASFAEMLTEALAAYKAAADDDTTSTEVEPTLVWSGYSSDDPSSTSWFRLTTSKTVNKDDLPS